MSLREVKLTEVDTRIENEIGLLRTNVEAIKFRSANPQLTLGTNSRAD